jgi:NTE family protein
MLKDFYARQCLTESVAFESLNALERQRLYQFCHLKKLKNGQSLIRQNSIHPYIYFLMQGALKVYFTDQNKQKKLVRVLMPATFVGEEGLFTGQNQLYEVKTSIDSVLIKIPYQIVNELMRSNAKLPWNLGVMLGKKVTQLEKQLHSPKAVSQMIAVMPGRKIKNTAQLSLQLALSLRKQFNKEVLLIDLNSQMHTIQELIKESKTYPYLVIHLAQSPKHQSLNQMILHYASVLIASQKEKSFQNRFFKFEPFYQTPAGVSRLARQIAGKTIGIALSSGMASSLYHVGVMKALKQAGLPIDAIAGCSGGALIGSLFTNGKKFHEIDTFIKHMIRKPFYQHLNLSLHKTHLVSFEPILKSLKKFLGEKKLSQTDTPLQIVATDLKTKKKYVFKRGDMYQAIGASFSMPFLSSVYHLKHKRLVDGYLTEPVPTPTLKEAGINYVLAVDVTDDGTPGDIKHFMDLYFHTRRTLTSNLRQAALQQSDLLIQPQFKKYKPLDYSMYPEYLKMGERAAKKIIPQIKKYLTE